MISRRRAVLAFGAGALVPLAAFAQQPSKIWRIGFLSPSSRGNVRAYDKFMAGLLELGYVEGKNFVIEWRGADGMNERLPNLAAELVALKVDAIMAASLAASIAAQRATTTIPIVFAGVSDPVGVGLVASLARPSGNITGMANGATEISGKLVEYLRAVLPKLSRVAMLMNPGGSNPLFLQQVQAAAKTVGMSVSVFEASTPAQIDAAFASMARARLGALIVSPSVLFGERDQQIAQLEAKGRLPAIHVLASLTDSNAPLMRYGANILETYRDAARQVDKILKGAKPAEIPVEQPTRFELVINRKAARALGLDIPQSLLLRADRVID